MRSIGTCLAVDADVPGEPVPVRTGYRRTPEQLMAIADRHALLMTQGFSAKKACHVLSRELDVVSPQVKRLVKRGRILQGLPPSTHVPTPKVQRVPHPTQPEAAVPPVQPAPAHTSAVSVPQRPDAAKLKDIALPVPSVFAYAAALGGGQ